jgi:hypothetical protein
MTPFPFIVFDTEDNSAELMERGKSGFKKKITQIAAIKSNGNRFHNRGNVPEFLSWIKRQKEQIIYAHNLQYDLGNLFGDSIDDLDVTLVGGRLIKAVWHEKTFRDSFNMWSMGLAKVGKVFGLAKKRFNAVSKAYVYRDCEIVERAIAFSQNAIKEFDIQLPATYGTLGVKIWKEIGGENWHDSDEFSLQGYYGGRVEVFKGSGQGNIAYCDINSLYPFCLTELFPDDPAPRKEIECRFGIADVEIDVPKDNWFGPLPVRRDDGAIVYPVGRFRGTWTCHELRNAQDHFGAKVRRVFKCVGTNAGRHYYADFVRYCYKRRREAVTDAEKTFWKFIMNSFYGRLGLTGIVGRSVYVTLENIDSGVLFGKKVLVNYKMPLDHHVNYFHVAHVTAYARVLLSDFVRRIGRANMIYCDTDSAIFFNQGKKLPFKIGGALGEMKLVGTADEFQVYAPKTYHFPLKGKKPEGWNDWKAKGVPVKKAQEFILTGETEFELPFRMREAITFFDRGNTRKLSVWRKVQKIRGSDYDKKRIAGSEFLPLTFNGRSKERETN